ncbi:predicted protein [Plenodomus lingam JN3]|uniref:Predicted protein n=2 Tax=Leptosphaeria maculans TaxID=5022 RepID=E5A1M6_LEPMJ|nr:predicted protein [Plenodomus lingam JN3]CBX97490.1 predicted protein [Plenodomus lingam JN3]
MRNNETLSSPNCCVSFHSPFHPMSMIVLVKPGFSLHQVETLHLPESASIDNKIFLQGVLRRYKNKTIFGKKFPPHSAALCTGHIFETPRHSTPLLAARADELTIWCRKILSGDKLDVNDRRIGIDIVDHGIDGIFRQRQQIPGKFSEAEIPL